MGSGGPQGTGRTNAGGHRKRRAPRRAPRVVHGGGPYGGGSTPSPRRRRQTSRTIARTPTRAPRKPRAPVSSHTKEHVAQTRIQRHKPKVKRKKMRIVPTAGGSARVLPEAQARKLLAQGRRNAVAREKESVRIGGFPKATKKRDTEGFKVAGFNPPKIAGALEHGALDVLAQTTRVSHGIAAAADAELNPKTRHGTGPLKAAWKGLKNEDKASFARVLRHAGVKNKLVSNVLGGAADIATDPLTYPTFGAGAVKGAAIKAAEKAGTKAETKALAEGASRKVAKKAKSTASRRAYGKAPHNRGVTIDAFGKRAPGLERATARASKTLGASATAKAVAKGPPGRAARRVLHVRPEGIGPEEWNALNSADRQRRGVLLGESRRNARKARAVRKGLGGTYRRVLPERAAAGEKRKLLPRRRKPAPLEASQRVTDAIEAQDLSGLSRPEQMAAEAVTGEQKRLLTMRQQAGEKAKVYQPRTPAEPKGYVAHQPTFEIHDPKLLKQERQGTRHALPARRTTSLKDLSRAESRRAPMAALRQTHPDEYVQDLEVGLRAKGKKDISRAAATKYRSDVTQLGRPLKPNAKWDRKTEGVYTVKEGRLVDVSKEHFVGGQPGKDTVILKKAIAEHANATMDHIGRIPFLDKATSKIKWVLTVPNPQFWMRNAYGGLMNVWESGVRADKVAASTGTAIRTNRAVTRMHHAEETLGAKPSDFGPLRHLKKPPDTLPVGPGGKHMKTEEFLHELEHMNVTGSGQTSELLGAEVARRPKMQGFDDLPRFTAYIHFRRKGFSADRAAEKALEGQFDYGALSLAEKKIGRRIFPFYTFRSRNTAFQAKQLVKRPGKFATIQKIRERAADQEGLPPDWEDHLSQGERQGVPIPVPGIKGHQLGYPGLPITDLNLVSTNPSQVFQQVAQSVHPGAKALVEFLTNYNFYWRDHIEGPGRRWTSAPDAIVNKMPAQARDGLIKAGVLRKGTDRWSGKTTWQWRGKADYLAKLTPLTSTGFLLASAGKSRRGQTKEQRGVAWATGLRTQPYTPALNHYYHLQDQRAKVKQKMDDLIELRTYKTRDKHEYKQLGKKYTKLWNQIYDLEGELGKKDRSAPPGRRKSGGGGSSQSDSGDISGFGTGGGGGGASGF